MRRAAHQRQTKERQVSNNQKLPGQQSLECPWLSFSLSNHLRYSMSVMPNFLVNQSAQEMRLIGVSSCRCSYANFAA
jgi:hypothetical protein